MVKDPIRRHDAAIGGASVESRTGRSREAWFTLLDAAGALGWDHRTTARWLLEEHGVDPWWCQAVTVGYEQARGLRAPGQRKDGTFEAGVTKTLPLPLAEAFAWVGEPDRRGRWLDVDPEVRGATPPKSVRWGWPDGTRVNVQLLGVAGGRTRVSVQHRDLPTDEALTEHKAYWRDRLAALAAVVASDAR